MTAVVSAPAPTVRPPMRWHPWRVLRRTPDLYVQWTDDLPADTLGAYDGHGTVFLASGQLQTEARCTLTHEQVHAERGDVGHCDPKTERRVRREAARRLVPVRALAEALLFHGERDLPAVADELWVDLDTLTVRLDTMHPADRGYLTRRLQDREDSA